MTAGDLETATSSAVIDRRYSVPSCLCGFYAPYASQFCFLLLLFARRRWGRPGEFRRVNRDVWLHLSQLNSCLPVRPGRGPAERHLDAGDLAIIRVVNLRGNTADRRVGKAHH